MAISCQCNTYKNIQNKTYNDDDNVSLEPQQMVNAPHIQTEIMTYYDEDDNVCMK
jgi:hypothetical protein